MSSLTVFGFFAVTGGRRVATQKPGSNTKTYYCFYTTALQSTDGASLPAQLRIYSPVNDRVLEDNTVVFAVSRAHMPAHETILLDVSHMYPIPGDPSAPEAYDAHLPDCCVPFIIGLGTVPARAELLSDNASKAFNVVSSEFVRDSLKTSIIQCVYHYVLCSHLSHFNSRCVYDGSRPRWNNTPTPNVNTTIQYVGTFSAVNANGCVRVNVENISFNVGQQEASAPSPLTATPKKRKFAAIATSPYV